jgi:hypothetical protein
MVEALMTGTTGKQGTMFMVFNLEERVPADLPLRKIKLMADEELIRLSPVLSKMY